MNLAGAQFLHKNGHNMIRHGYISCYNHLGTVASLVGCFVFCLIVFNKFLTRKRLELHYLRWETDSS